MRLAIIGRTLLLVTIARLLLLEGHEIGLVVTPEDNGTSAPFRALARDCAAKLIVTAKINSEPILEMLRMAACDVAVSLNWRTMIGAMALASFRHGVLNCHAGALPRFRGNACPNWAILQQEREIGLCVHEMTLELDAGPIYARATYPLKPGTYITDVHQWMEATAPGLFSQALASIAAGRLPVAQDPDPSAALRCYPRRASDARIDWRQSAEQIHRLVRASSRPFDGAFCYLEDRLVTIWRAKLARPVSNYLAVPGQPCEPIEGDPAIACGEGLLRLEEVKIDRLTNHESKAIINRSVRQRLT